MNGEWRPAHMIHSGANQSLISLNNSINIFQHTCKFSLREIEILFTSAHETQIIVSCARRTCCKAIVLVSFLR